MTVPVEGREPTSNMVKDEKVVNEVLSADEDHPHDEEDPMEKDNRVTTEDPTAPDFEDGAPLPPPEPSTHSLVPSNSTSQLLTPQHRMMVDERTLRLSILAVQFGILADAVSTTILQPNFPFLARPGENKDSFPNTKPFGVDTATYFLPMTALGSAAVVSIFTGALSDKWGRRPVLLICVGVSVLGSLAKYFARHTFWGFCAANVANGVFGGCVPVALAYISDVYANRAKKDEAIGVIVGISMIGMTGGGIVAVLFQEEGLFLPLLVGAAVNLLAFIFMWFYMIEPDPRFRIGVENSDDDVDAPETLHVPTVSLVVFGAMLDNIGSSGLIFMAISPLLFETWYEDFTKEGLDPIMSGLEFKWLSALLALMVIPGTCQYCTSLWHVSV